MGKRIANPAKVEELSTKLGDVPSGKTAQGEIDELNSKFTIQEEALTSPYATSPETAFVKRTGNVVYWQFTAALTTALPMNTVFITIPQGFRPSNGKTRFTCYNSSDKKAILVSMGSNGDTQLIDYGSTLASSTVLQLSGTFIV